MRCASHPDVETNLRCGKCGKPICPKCLVETPVGARCRECARLNKLPTYRVPARYYVRAAGAALAAGVVCGIIWAAIYGILPFYVSWLVGIGVGYAIGEVVSRATNRKRGRGLAVVAAMGVVVSYAVMVFLEGHAFRAGLIGILGLVSLAVGIYFAVNRLR